MKKLLWFTQAQDKMLTAIKKITGDNNSEAVRKGLELYYDKLISDGKGGDNK